MSLQWLPAPTSDSALHNSAVSGQDDSGPEDAHTLSKELHLEFQNSTPRVVPVGHIARATSSMTGGSRTAKIWAARVT